MSELMPDKSSLINYFSTSYAPRSNEAYYEPVRIYQRQYAAALHAMLTGYYQALKLRRRRWL
ncbi:MAG: hypothetical protein ACXV2B_00260 [Halobacteriota archaeon]